MVKFEGSQIRQIFPSTSAPHNVSILLFKTNIETIFLTFYFISPDCRVSRSYIFQTKSFLMATKICNTGKGPNDQTKKKKISEAIEQSKRDVSLFKNVSVGQSNKRRRLLCFSQLHFFCFALWTEEGRNWIISPCLNL